MTAVPPLGDKVVQLELIVLRADAVHKVLLRYISAHTRMDE